MPKVELLSPAGSFEKLKIAIEYGADAVYAGVSQFSLRSRTGKEFNYESFAEAIKYVHDKGKRIYATINGFPFNAQINSLKKHLEKMGSLDPDAFIIATPGVIRLSKQIAPHIPIHLSTQANVLNYLDAEVYYEMGVKRIVAAREISLNDLCKIKEHLPDLELEIFVHGSMCFAYSGRCLVSSIQSGRVSNRGTCANDCRFPYELYANNKDSGTLFKLEEHDEGTYILNARDLNLASRLDEILEKDIISSFKIEGRTKSPYYVATTAKTYKNAIDDFYNGKFNAKKYETELNSIKNRGFSQGYVLNHPSEKRLGLQNLQTSISNGSHQVYGLVGEDGKSFLAKDTIIKNYPYELMSPLEVEPFENDIGKIEKHGDFVMITFKKLISTENKEFEAIHSGNTNRILLPTKLPKFSFLRLKSSIDIRAIKN